MNHARSLLSGVAVAVLAAHGAHAERIYTDHTIPVEGAVSLAGSTAGGARVYQGEGSADRSRTVVADTRELRDDDPAVEPLSAARLEQLVAPVALYPDTLLAQVLIAATYPLEVVEAARWSRANPGLEGDAALEAVADRDWDPSVQALVAFPDVLARMDNDLEWMQDLGEAFLYQEAGLVAAVQHLRGHASDAGTLDQMEHAQVVREQETIIIEPVRERVVYVPYYDTRVVYGPWRHVHYAPVYWAPPRHYVTAGSYFYWSHGITVSSGFHFSTFHWPARHVYVVPRHRPHVHLHFHSAPRKHVHVHGTRWRHDPVHRRGVRYRHRGVEQQWSGARDRSHYAQRSPRRDGRDQVRRGDPPRLASAPRNRSSWPEASWRGGNDRGWTGANRANRSAPADRGRTEHRRRHAEDVGARIAGSSGRGTPNVRETPRQRVAGGAGMRAAPGERSNHRATRPSAAAGRPHQARNTGQGRNQTRRDAGRPSVSTNRRWAETRTDTPGARTGRLPGSRGAAPTPRVNRGDGTRSDAPRSRSNRGTNAPRRDSASQSAPAHPRASTRGRNHDSTRTRGTPRNEGRRSGSASRGGGARGESRGQSRRLGGGRQGDR